MLDDALVASLARHWDEGWNGPDLDTILAPFADDIVFSSPYVSKGLGDPSLDTIEGLPALRDYCAAALQRSGDVRYTLHQTYTGTDTVVLVYTCHLPDGRDRPGADLMRLDAHGKVAEWRCHYTSDPTQWRP